MLPNDFFCYKRSKQHSQMGLYLYYTTPTSNTVLKATNHYARKRLGIFWSWKTRRPTLEERYLLVSGRLLYDRVQCLIRQTDISISRNCGTNGLNLTHKRNMDVDVAEINVRERPRVTYAIQCYQPTILKAHEFSVKWSKLKLKTIIMRTWRTWWSE